MRINISIEFDDEEDENPNKILDGSQREQEKRSIGRHIQRRVSSHCRDMIGLTHMYSRASSANI